MVVYFVSFVWALFKWNIFISGRLIWTANFDNFPDLKSITINNDYSIAASTFWTNAWKEYVADFNRIGKGHAVFYHDLHRNTRYRHYMRVNITKSHTSPSQWHHQMKSHFHIFIALYWSMNKYYTRSNCEFSCWCKISASSPNSIAKTLFNIIGCLEIGLLKHDQRQ